MVFTDEQKCSGAYGRYQESKATRRLGGVRATFFLQLLFIGAAKFNLGLRLLQTCSKRTVSVVNEAVEHFRTVFVILI